VYARKWGGICAETGYPLKLPSPTNLAPLGHFPPRRGALPARCSMFICLFFGKRHASSRNLPPPCTVYTKGVGPGTTLAWPGWRQPDIPVEVDTARLEISRTEAGVLQKLSLAGIAKLRFVWPQPTIMDSELTIGWCTQLIPQSSMKPLGLARLA
jgi:hypothetical protein